MRVYVCDVLLVHNNECDSGGKTRSDLCMHLCKFMYVYVLIIYQNESDIGENHYSVCTHLSKCTHACMYVRVLHVLFVYQNEEQKNENLKANCLDLVSW